MRSKLNSKPNTGLRWRCCPQIWHLTGIFYTENFDTPGFVGLRIERIPRFLWMSVDSVVKESLNRLHPGNAVVIPGVLNRIFYVGVLLNPFGEQITRRLWMWLYPTK